MNIYNINLNLLKLLYALLTEANVSKAAQRTFITQPAMSNALIRLRKIFNDPLLVRSGQSMILTPLARTLLPKLKSIFFDLEHLTDFEFNPKTTDKIFSLGMFDYTEPLLLPKIINYLAKNAPHIKLHIKELGIIFDPKIIEEKQLDFAISILNAPANYLRSNTLLHEEPICIMRQNHPFSRSPLTLKKYLQASHLAIQTTNEPIDNYIDRTLIEKGYYRKIVIATSNIVSALAIIAKTDLITVVTKSLAEAYKHTFKLHLVDLPFKTTIETVEIALIWHECFNKNPMHQWLRKIIQESVKGK